MCCSTRSSSCTSCVRVCGLQAREGGGMPVVTLSIGAVWCHDTSVKLWQQGLGLQEVSTCRGVSLSTAYSYILEGIKAGAAYRYE